MTLIDYPISRHSEFVNTAHQTRDHISVKCTENEKIRAR